MTSLVLAPHRALQPYIVGYVHHEFGTPDAWTRADLAPVALAAMPVTIGGTRIRLQDQGDFESIAFGGQMTRFKALSWYSRASIFYVFFRPWGAYALLGVPQQQCTDLFVNLSDLLGTPAKLLGEMLAEQTDVDVVRRSLDEFFLKRLALQRKPEVSLRLASVVAQIGRFSHERNVIDRICRISGYSISRLERHMNEIVGLRPKQYQRIMRFNAALAYIQGDPLQHNWCWIADQFGYFDQTHFIKEFKFFYGRTPTEAADGTDFISAVATSLRPADAVPETTPGRAPLPTVQQL